MPGAYAHITLANLLKEPARLEAIPAFPVEAISAVLDYFKFCELGAVSPDYPYLSVGDKKAEAWANLMHYTRTGAMLQVGIGKLRGLPKETMRKGLAWLLGYAAHVAADVSIHPVINLKVGRYEDNKRMHRVCELNQDAHIFQRMNLGGVGLSEHLDSGIGGCCNPRNKKQLDMDLVDLWKSILKEVHPVEFKKNPPDFNKWHKFFKLMVDDVAEEGNKLMPFARHLGVKSGLTYPTADEIDRQFIDGLAVPGGAHEGYDSIFDRTIGNVGGVWQLIASGVLQGDAKYVARLGTWNLDTGMDENGRMVFWS